MRGRVEWGDEAMGGGKEAGGWWKLMVPVAALGIWVAVTRRRTGGKRAHGAAPSKSPWPFLGSPQAGPALPTKGAVTSKSS